MKRATLRAPNKREGKIHDFLAEELSVVRAHVHYTKTSNFERNLAVFRALEGRVVESIDPWKMSLRVSIGSIWP